MSKSEVGVALGLIFGIGGAVGTFAGGLFEVIFSATKSRRRHKAVFSVFVTYLVPSWQMNTTWD